MKKVLVTGATGSIGAEIVKEYAKNDFFVYIHYNSNHQKAQNLLEEIDNKGELISFDIKDKESIKNSLENLDVDVLINNAGIIKDNLFFFMSDDEWEDVINTNLNGNFYITKIISKNMMMNKKGSIVNIASISGVSGNGAVPKENYIKPLIRTELEGLCIKTLQSDIFNNWVNKEWVDGDNGIGAITAIDVADGKLTIDSLNLAQKVYNMLNRIAVSGGTYKDWIETVYDTDFYFRAETPIYEGGMSTMIDFEPVVSTADGRNGEEPLGSLAGRGVSGERKGGRIKIKVTEPCYIIGIASITPLVDYSQGNEWDNWLDTLDDLHKPELDAIGWQDLMANIMHFRANTTDAIGKQPAWINYMTNYLS